MSADSNYIYWDAIVVGAGIGGLSAAARLVQAGLRVLVVEKNHHPGGTAYVYKRKGFTFPMGPLSFSSPALMKKHLSDLGQPDELHLSRVHYQICAFGFQVLLSRPFGLLVEDLSSVFPNDVEGMTRFFQEMGRMLLAIQSPEMEDNRMLLEKTKGISARAYLESLVGDWRLRRFLGSLGTREPYGNIPLMAAMWNLMSTEGIWYPSGGMRSLCDSLARVVATKRGDTGGIGEIRLGVKVKEIRVRHGQAEGIVLEDGTMIDGKRIISNADFKTTFVRLLGPHAVLDPWYRAIVRAKLTGSMFQVCLGVDSSRVDLSAFSEASRLIYRKSRNGSGLVSEEMDWAAAEVTGKALAAQELEVSLMSRDDPTLAPERGSVIVVRTEADHGHFLKCRSSEQRREAGYNEYKRRLATALIREAGNIIPGLEEAVLVMDTASPLTFEDQGGRSEGAVAGWSWDYEDALDYVPVELIRTPVRGLYMAGHQAYSALFMGGVPAALESGVRAAEYLLQDAGPVEDMRIPGGC
jgi:phytoene dehydrogenase-like protein